MGFFKNVITFGASGRIEKKINEYDGYVKEYKNTYSNLEKRRKEVNKVLEKVMKEKVNSLKSLKKIDKISKNLKSKERTFDQSEIKLSNINDNFQRIENVISIGDAAMSATKGVASGVGTALGSWALVGAYGTASTGTAISALGGAAATNATLAWFGGGSIAAGGGGMAAGSLTLGGIVAIPALAVAGILSHLKANKKINEIEEKIYEIRTVISQIKDNLLLMNATEERAKEVIDSLIKARAVFNRELNKSYKKIYPIPLISSIIKSIRKNILRMNYFSKKDMEEIQYIGQIATNFADIIDSKVF